MTAGLKKPQQEINNVISSVSCKISIRQTASQTKQRRGEGGPGRWLVLMMLILTLLSAIISTNYPAQATSGKLIISKPVISVPQTRLQFVSDFIYGGWELPPRLVKKCVELVGWTNIMGD